MIERGHGAAAQRLGRRMQRASQSLLGVGDLGAQIRTRTGLHQAHELFVERGRLGAEGLEFLTVVAEQCRDRDGYLVGAGSRNRSRGGRGQPGGLAQRRADPRQIVGRRLNQFRRDDYERHLFPSQQPASNCGTPANRERARTARVHMVESGFDAGSLTRVTVRCDDGLSHEW